jgi:hypothetical protein
LDFWVWLISLNMMTSDSVHFPANDKISLLFGWIIFHCGYSPHFLYPFVCCWAPRGFHSSTKVNSAVINMGVHGYLSCILVQTPLYICQEWYGRS